MQIAVIPNEAGLRELTLIELQGTLEVNQDLSNLEFGKIHWNSNGNAFLRIGHNQFEGKFVKLEKPLLLLDKSTKVIELSTDSSKSNSSTVSVEGIIERKLLFNIRPRPIIGTPGNAAPVKALSSISIFGGKK